MQNNSNLQNATLQFPDLYSLWSFARTLSHNNLQINTIKKTLTCDCAATDIETATTLFGASLVQEYSRQ